MEDEKVVEILARILCFNPALDIYGRAYVPIYYGWLWEQVEKLGIQREDVGKRQQELLRGSVRRMCNDKSKSTIKD